MNITYRHRRGPAHLHRAHQHRRQFPHRGRRHPPSSSGLPRATPSTGCWSRRRASDCARLASSRPSRSTPSRAARPTASFILVKVVEQPTGELSFGAGYSTSEGVIGDISITERNLMGKGQYVRLGFSGSLDRAQVDFSFTEPLFPRSQSRRRLRPLPQGGRSSRRRLVQAARHRRQYPARLPASPTTPSWACATGSSARRSTTWPDNASLAVEQAAGIVQRVERRLHRRLRHAQHTEFADQRRLRLVLAGPGRRRRRRELHPLGRRRPRLLSRSPTRSPWSAARRAAPSRDGAATTFA